MGFVSGVSCLLALYVLFSYGIGLNFILATRGYQTARLFKMTLKMAAAALLATAVLWFPFSAPRIAAALSGLLPILAVAVSCALSKALSTLLPDDFTDSRLEIEEALFVLSAALLSIREGLGLLDALLTCISCFLSFALFLFLMTAALSRLAPLRLPPSRAGLALALVLLGIFSFIGPLFDVIWSLNPASG